MGMKALVFDLDDTLLDTSKLIGPSTLRCLYEWLDGGREVILATGRPVRWVRHHLPDRLMASADLLTMNGAVHHVSGRLVWRSKRLGSGARRIVTEFPDDPPVAISIEVDGDHFGSTVSHTDEELFAYHAAPRDLVIDLGTLDYGAVAKVSVDGLGRRIDQHISWIGDSGMHVIPCLDGTFLNIVPEGVDKSVTLARLLEQRGIGRNEFAVFGDDIPDVEMMRMSDHAVAMANARDEVKAAAHVVIGHCDDDAIGEYVSKNWM